MTALPAGQATNGSSSEASPGFRRISVAVVLILLALAPLVLSDASLGVVGRGLVAALFALAFNVLAGQAGMLSFGHAAYFAFGAFATIHLMVAIDHGAVWWPTPLLPLAGAGAGLFCGAVAGYFATLRSGVYFSMVTLAISEFFFVIAPSMSGFFGGETGFTSMRQPFGGLSFGSEAQVYALTATWVIICAGLLYLFTQTLFGRLTTALRENERRLPALGYDVHKTKVLVFAISGMFSGIAGSLLVISTESANYTLFHLGTSTSVVLNTIIGGTSTFLGPAIGALVMTVFGYAASEATRSWLLYQGLIFIAVMLWAPRGVTPLVADIWNGFVRRTISPLRALVVILGMVAAAAGTVLLIELLARLFDRDYVTTLQQTGIWAPVTLMRHSWPVFSPVTWVLPLALIAIGLTLLLKGRSGDRA